MLLLPFIASIAAPLIGGLFGRKGQKDANQSNVREAQKNRAFQERMSSTSWQRGVKDMELAGLNPALAYGQGGASSPGGTLASKQESELGAGVSSAMAAKSLQASLSQIGAQTDAARAQADKTRQETRGIRDRDSILYGQTTRPDGQWRRPLFEQLQRAQLETATLQLPYLRNAARVESSRLGANAAWMDRILRSGSGLSPFFKKR